MHRGGVYQYALLKWWEFRFRLPDRLRFDELIILNNLAKIFQLPLYHEANEHFHVHLM